MKRAILFISAVLLFSACGKADKFSHVLTGQGEQQYWVRKAMDSTGVFKDLFDRFKFRPDGTCEIYHSAQESELGEKWRGMEGDNHDKWSFDPRDSSFKIDALSYKVIRFSADSIIMTGNGYTGRFALTSSEAAGRK